MNCSHPELLVLPGIDFATGMDMPGPVRVICLACGEEVEEDEDVT